MILNPIQERALLAVFEARQAPSDETLAVIRDLHIALDDRRSMRNHIEQKIPARHST